MTTLGIAAGQSQALALRSDGSVWTWGTNQVGEMGISNLTGSYFPLRIPGLTNVTGIAAGWQHSLAVEGNGTVWAWGDNSGGQLGNGNSNSAVPVQVTGITNAVARIGRICYSLALLANGQVLAWGTNSAGQLGQWNHQFHQSTDSGVEFDQRGQSCGRRISFRGLGRIRGGVVLGLRRCMAKSATARITLSSRRSRS